MDFSFLKQIRQTVNCRYSDAITPSTVVTQTVHGGKSPAEATAGRKSKNVAKAQTSTKIKPTLVPPTQNEDTCNSDDFSSFYQASNTDNK